MKKRIIKFIPKNEYVPSYAPKPEPAWKNIPAWWKNQEAYPYGKEPIDGVVKQTVKKCPGLQDLLFTGYTLKFPCDVYVDTTGDEIIYEALEIHKQSFSIHIKEQIDKWDFDRKEFMDSAFRIHPMWVISTSPGTSTLFIQPPYTENLPFKTIPAIIDTDTYVSDGPFSVLIKRNFKGIIKQGTPLVQCIPYLREEWNSEILEKPEIKTFKTLGAVIKSNFTNSYKKLLWHKKVFK